MTQEEFKHGINKIESKQKDIISKFSEHLLHAGEYIKSLEEQNIELQARIKELEEPKTCNSCGHIKWSNPLSGFICKEGITNYISKLGSGCINNHNDFYCKHYKLK